MLLNESNNCLILKPYLHWNIFSLSCVQCSSTQHDGNKWVKPAVSPRLTYEQSVVLPLYIFYWIISCQLHTTLQVKFSIYGKKCTFISSGYMQNISTLGYQGLLEIIVVCVFFTTMGCVEPMYCPDKL